MSDEVRVGNGCEEKYHVLASRPEWTPPGGVVIVAVEGEARAMVRVNAAGVARLVAYLAADPCSAFRLHGDGPYTRSEVEAIVEIALAARNYGAGRAPLSPEIREALEVALAALAVARSDTDFVREEASATLRSFLSVSQEPEMPSLTGDERGRLKEVRAALRTVLGTARNASGISPEEEQAIRVLEPLVAVAVSQEGKSDGR